MIYWGPNNESILKSQPTIDGDHGFDRYKHTNKFVDSIRVVL